MNGAADSVVPDRLVTPSQAAGWDQDRFVVRGCWRISCGHGRPTGRIR
jgi:hypothetical protein